MSKLDSDQEEAIALLILIFVVIPLIILFGPALFSKIPVSAPPVCTTSETWWADGSGPLGSDYNTNMVDINEAHKVAGDDRLFHKEVCRY